MRELILGGARSGKSRLALKRAQAGGLSVVYIATATAEDEEMRERIARHQAERPTEWRVVEESLHLAATLARHDSTGHCLVVDCLTLWLSNLLAAAQPGLYEQERAALIAFLPQARGHLLMVSNEVGLGIVPANPLARRFRDEAGRLHQELAAHCERVTFVAAGLPLLLKGAE